MGTKTKQQEKKLTAYESRQVEKIAAWKAEFPNPFGELFRRTVQPLANVVENIIPDRLALKAIDASYNVSDYTATLGDIKIQAGVKDITELRHKPLEVCDDLSRRVGTAAQGIATVEGVLTGAGGVISTLLDVPLLFTLCLRTIIKIGHCYGYPLDRPTDKAWVLGALAVALSATKEKRTDLMVRLREIEELLVEEVQENIVVEETASLLTQIEILEDIPVVGAVTGGLLNLSVAHRTDVTARHLFQEALAAGQRQGRGDRARSAPRRCSAALRVVRCLCTGRLQHPAQSEFRRGISILPGGRDLHPGHSFFDLANWGPGRGERRQRAPRWPGRGPGGDGHPRREDPLLSERA